MTRIVTLDCETTTGIKHSPPKGNFGDPFDPRNKLCSVGILDNDTYTDFPIEFSTSSYIGLLPSIQASLRDNVIVGFNLKFDLHWLRRYLGDLFITGSIWDCQLAEYVLSYQKEMFPSLDDACARRGLGRKLDVVKSQYWAKGLDTDEVPYPILAEYLEQDVRLTRNLYEDQLRQFELPGNEELYNLFKLGCEDQKWLMEAEWNGMDYDVETSLRKAVELSTEHSAITGQLSNMYNCPHLDWGSNDHVSLVLFGGILYYRGKEKYIKELKAGPVERERNAWLPWVFKRKLKPDFKTQNDPCDKIKTDEELEEINNQRVAERLKPFVRTFSVAEPVLRNYSTRGTVRQTIDLLLRRSELTKLIKTYYEGIPKIIVERSWDRLHGQFNQTASRTGRLSSSKPNLQNFVGELKPLFRSRYE